jgi:hypothetical protein
MVRERLARREFTAYAPAMPPRGRWVWTAVLTHPGVWVVSRIGDSTCVITPTLQEGIAADSEDAHEKCERIAEALTRIYSGQM